jgi:hypothetical protein
MPGTKKAGQAVSVNAYRTKKYRLTFPAAKIKFSKISNVGKCSGLGRFPENISEF